MVGKIHLEDSESLFHAWFEIRSAMLFPDNPIRRKQAFDYDYYRFLIKHRDNSEFDFDKIPYKKIAIRFSKLISKKGFLKDLRSRRLSSNVAGMMIRLLHSMRYYGFPEPGINKAKSLYSYRYSDKKAVAKRKGKKIRFNVSKTYAGNSLKIHRDALPYCAAHIMSRPTAAVDVQNFKERFDHFLSIADSYRDFCLEYKHAKDVGTAKLVDESSLMKVISKHAIQAATDEGLKPYPIDLLYKYGLKEYEDQIEERMMKEPV